MSEVVLYDLVPELTAGHTPGPSFSPFCMRARLALERKRVEYDTEFVTYHDLRFGPWKERLGRDFVSAPIIRRPDGSFLMDSTEIALWLDETYPSEPNLFLPATAEGVVDLNSSAYLDAVKRFETVLKDVVNPERTKETGIRSRGAFWCGIFWLYARRIVSLFDRETAEYWIQDSRLGDGTWKSVVTTEPGPLVDSVRAGVEVLASHLGDSNSRFFSSETQPGMIDFALFGDIQLIRSVSPGLFHECFAAAPTSTPTRSESSTSSSLLTEWIESMDKLFPLTDVRKRDASQEIEVCTE